MILRLEGWTRGSEVEDIAGDVISQLIQAGRRQEMTTT